MNTQTRRRKKRHPDIIDRTLRAELRRVLDEKARVDEHARRLDEHDRRLEMLETPPPKGA